MNTFRECEALAGLEELERIARYAKTKDEMEIEAENNAIIKKRDD